MSERITNKKQAVKQLERLAAIEAMTRNLTANQKAELEPFVKKFEKATAQINATYNGQFAPLNAERAELTAALNDFLLNELNADGGYKFPELAATFDGLQAVAQVALRSVRELDPQRWFTAIKDRTDKFWSTIKVGIQAADKAFGKSTVDEHADNKTSASVNLKFVTVTVAEE